MSSARSSTTFGTLVARELSIFCNRDEIRLTLMLVPLNVTALIQNREDVCYFRYLPIT
jgi:hypothetical protein